MVGIRCCVVVVIVVVVVVDVVVAVVGIRLLAVSQFEEDCHLKHLHVLSRFH